MRIRMQKDHNYTHAKDPIVRARVRWMTETVE